MMIPPIPYAPRDARTLALRLDVHRRVLWSFRNGVTLERLDQIRLYVDRERARGDLTFDPELVAWEWNT